MSHKEVIGSEESATKTGFSVAAFATSPLNLMSIPPLFAQSTPDHMNSLRDMDILGIPNFFDHAGNFCNGILAAEAAAAVGILAEKYVPEEKKNAVIIGTAAVAASTAIGVNVAYEAGVEIPPYPQKPAEAPFDGQDALYGSISGTLFSAVFCYVALRARKKAKELASE